MTTELTPSEVGRISYVIGKKREQIPAEMLDGYDAAKEAAEAKAARLAAEMAAFNAAHPELQNLPAND